MKNHTRLPFAIVNIEIALTWECLFNAFRIFSTDRWINCGTESWTIGVDHYGSRHQKHHCKQQKNNQTYSYIVDKYKILKWLTEKKEKRGLHLDTTFRTELNWKFSTVAFIMSTYRWFCWHCFLTIIEIIVNITMVH